MGCSCSTDASTARSTPPRTEAPPAPAEVPAVDPRRPRGSVTTEAVHTTTTGATINTAATRRVILASSTSPSGVTQLIRIVHQPNSAAAIAAQQQQQGEQHAPRAQSGVGAEIELTDNDDDEEDDEIFFGRHGAGMTMTEAGRGAAIAHPVPAGASRQGPAGGATIRHVVDADFLLAQLLFHEELERAERESRARRLRGARGGDPVTGDAPPVVRGLSHAEISDIGQVFTVGAERKKRKAAAAQETKDPPPRTTEAAVDNATATGATRGVSSDCAPTSHAPTLVQSTGDTSSHTIQATHDGVVLAEHSDEREGAAAAGADASTPVASNIVAAIVDPHDDAVVVSEATPPPPPSLGQATPPLVVVEGVPVAEGGVTPIGVCCETPPGLLNDKHNDSPPDSDGEDGEIPECSLCLEPLLDGDEVRELYCEHLYHRTCVDAWLQKKRLCPICCQDVTKISVRMSTASLFDSARRAKRSLGSKLR